MYPGGSLVVFDGWATLLMEIKQKRLGQALTSLCKALVSNTPNDDTLSDGQSLGQVT
jgi:hypothetical protein